jgi:membrane-associated phospholipid phosphatase
VSLAGSEVAPPSVGAQATPAKERRDEGIEPGAGDWKTWVLESGSQLRLPPPPTRRQTKEEIRILEELASERNEAALDRINFWDAGSPSFRWNQIAIERVIAANLAGPRAGRVLALVNIAIYDAMIAAWDSKYHYRRERPGEFDKSLSTVIADPNSPSYPSEHAAAAGAASAVLSYLFPANAQLFADRAEEAGHSRLVAGVQFPSDVEAGMELGRMVAALVIERARTDGSDAVFTGTIPQGPCNWKGVNPFEPTSGTWRTWVLTSGSQLRPGPPPACDYAKMAEELAEVKNFPRSIPATGATFGTTRLAFFWQGVESFIKPWNDFISQKIGESRLDTNPPRAARAYTLVHIAYYDALIACFEAKYHYWAIRPNQLDPTMTTLFPNPNHPSYPGAHASLSGAAGAMLGYLFPRDAEFFKARAEEAANSRLWAGIHFRSDNEVGLALSRAVAQLVIEQAESDGSQ